MMSFKNFLTEAVQGPLFINFGYINKGKVEEFLKDKLKNSKFAKWSDLTIVNSDITLEGSSLKNFSFVFVGVIGSNSDIGDTVIQYLKEHKVPCLLYGQTYETDNKIKMTVQLKDVPQIKTIIGTGSVLTAKELVNQLKLPLVSKIIDGSKGKGVKKHDDIGSIDKLLSADPEKVYIFQEFIPNDGDFRVFYIKRKLIYALKRMRVDDEFRNNTSLGGRYEMIDKMPDKALKIALKAIDATGYDISGVDLIQDSRTKDWFVMEVNAAPQFGGEEFKLVLEAIAKLITK